MRSLERHLLLWVLGALGLGAILLGIVAYQVVLDEMEEVFDENLKQVALALASHSELNGSGNTRLQLPALAHGYEEGGDFDFITDVFDKEGRILSRSDPAIHLPAGQATGLADVVVADQHWHVYTIVLNERVVQAAQRASSHRQLAVTTATELLSPLLLLVPVVGGLLVIALRRGLVPLDTAAAGVAARSALSLEPIDATATPREIGPLIQAMNGLMARLSTALDGQRRFTADAAHELRTPITALRLQLQLLESAANDIERKEARLELALGVERAQRLVEQLLDLSRTEPNAALDVFEPVDLAQQIRASISRWRKEADSKAIALLAGLDDTALMVAADPHQIELLLDNLVGNAVRYAGAGRRVEIRAGLIDGCITLRVIDDGPGMSVDERERAFDRFFRGRSAMLGGGTPGSGLGLAIVRAIAERHGATVALLPGPEGRGLEARVAFAAA